mgnify:CR=1 FL=1
MKKTFRFLFAAVAFAAAVSCANTLDEQKAGQAQEGQTHEVVFDIEDEPTKTAISVDGSKITLNWKNTPESNIYLYEEGKLGTNARITTSDSDRKAQLSASFSGLTLDYSHYNAVIASDYQDGIITVPSVQYPAANSFDPDADVLIGQGDKVQVIVRSAVTLKFARAVAISRLHLSGLKAGEKVASVEIAATNNIAGELNPLVKFQYDGYSENGTNKIVLNYSENNEVSAEGTFDAWFTSWAVKPGSFKVTVITDKSVYSKSAPADKAAELQFKRDMLKTINVALENQEIQSERYELVTSAPASWDGTYIIVNAASEGPAKIFNASDKSGGYADDVTILDIAGKKVINATDAIDNLSWDISNTGRTSNGSKLWNVTTGSAGFLGIIGRDLKYLYDNEGITVSSNNYTGWLLNRTYYYHMFDYDGGVKMASWNGKKNTWLGWTGSAFAYGSNNASRVYLYKYSDNSRQSQILAYDKDLVHWTIAEGKYQLNQTYDGQAFSSSSRYQSDLLTFSSSDESVAKVDEKTGRVTILKEGNVTITVVAATTAEYRGATASYEIVIAKPYYEKVTSTDQITSGDKYIIVSTTSTLLGKLYHNFSAAKEGSYNYNLIQDLGDIFSSPVYDNGNKIRPNAAIDANQVEIENNLLTAVASLVGLRGVYTIKPVAVDKYLYCNMEVSTLPNTTVPFVTYGIAFSDVNLESISLSGIGSWFSKIATIPHSITFAEDGSVSIRSAVSSYSTVGADLFYNTLTEQYGYVNMSMLDGIDNIDDLLAYIGQNSQYAALLNFIKLLGDNISIKSLINAFSGDLYIYKYIG